jgi:glycosyltransferase involved in cell wall biosynthesis
MSQFNWEPTVITTGNVAYFAHDLNMLKEAEDANVRIIRTEAFDVNAIIGKKFETVTMPREFVRKTLSSISKAVFIPDNKKSWAKKAYKVAAELLSKEKFDIIYTSVPPYSSFITAAKLKREFNIPLFVDYRDLWFNSQFSFYPTPYHRIKHKKLEYNSLRSADKVITINRKIKEKMLLTYPFLSYNDILIIPHGFDPEDFEKNTANPRISNKMRITYSGIFYDAITPEYFIKAFKKLSEERPDIAANIELEFIGLLRKEYKKLITELGLGEYVIDNGYLEHDQVIKKLKSTDVLWFMIGKMKSGDTISTSKLYEYFGTRKPILGCIPEGAAAYALQEYKASFIVDPYDIDAIKNELVKINELFRNNKLPVPPEDVVEKYNRKNLTEQLTKALQFFVQE